MEKSLGGALGLALGNSTELTDLPLREPQTFTSRLDEEVLEP
jgi:hypothetical protein